MTSHSNDDDEPKNTPKLPRATWSDEAKRRRELERASRLLDTESAEADRGPPDDADVLEVYGLPPEPERLSVYGLPAERRRVDEHAPAPVYGLPPDDAYDRQTPDARPGWGWGWSLTAAVVLGAAVVAAVYWLTTR